MIRASLIGIALIGATGCAAIDEYYSPIARDGPGQAVLDAAFNPYNAFAGDLRESSDDEMILAVWASARDDYAPAYSLAIAYRCIPPTEGEEWSCGYFARMLRTGDAVENSLEKGLSLYWQAQEAGNASDMKRHLDEAALDWLEADVAECDGGIFAMDSIRIADWNPDIHYKLQEVEDRELILHPAAIKVRMHGSYATSTYEGWILANGVPAAVQKLVKTLEPCWKSGKSPKPWNRRGYKAADD